MDYAEVLLRAASHMEKVGKAEGVYFSYPDSLGDLSKVPLRELEKAPCCMLGAVHLSVYKMANSGSPYKHILGPIPPRILTAIRRVIAEQGAINRIPRYSDNHSLAECVDVLRQASHEV